MAKAWERREKESAKAFAAFELYRNMPAPERSASNVGPLCGKSASLTTRWCTQHEWVSRARAFDESVAMADAERLKAKRLKESEEMRERYRVVGRLVMARTTKAISREVDGEGVIPIETSVDVYRMMKTATMLEQIGHETAGDPGRAVSSGDNRGMDEDVPRITKLEVEIITDGGKRISGDDIAAQLRAFYDKPNG